MNAAFDIDDTIKKDPKFFSMMSKTIRDNGGRVIIMTTRTDDRAVRKHTQEELKSYDVVYDELILLPNSGSPNQEQCPHEHLDWYQRYLWQKVKLCLDNDVNIVFDDDIKTVDLFKSLAPHILVFQPR